MARQDAQAVSRRMKRVRREDTAPEMAVRALLHAANYRFRLHLDSLPGKPDIVFTARKKVIFVHGCFWHRHDCRRGRQPSSNVEYWNRKIEKNVERDERVLTELVNRGWQPFIVWECQLTNKSEALKRLVDFLGATRVDETLRDADRIDKIAKRR
jgi:DNA mismatch endonuclease, patch repair protein